MYKFKEDNMIVPCYVWAEQGGIEQGAIDQIKNASSLPFVFHHTVLCPDAHQGYGVSIGSVVALKNVISPMMVGVDIGCGMCAVKTSLTEIDIDTLKKIMGEIRKSIPVGFSHHKEKQDESFMPEIKDYLWKTDRMTRMEIVGKEYERALTQIGTLGGGNHFIEIQKGSDGHIWIMVHSGSRNIGLKIAKHYNELAYDLNTRWHSNTFLPSNKEDSLAFFLIDSEEGQAYLREMQYAVDFALANRKLMMDRIQNIVGYICGYNKDTNVYFEPMINIAHNYASLENHFGENVWIHRKGATLARKGTIGIIPGSMGTASYIVEGLGNPDSFESCSHGAGRRMGRGQAIRTLNLEEEQKKMEGIIGAPRVQHDLEEAPGAYKPIDEVMRNQADLVKILVELKPLAVIKG
jgi:tRNA-splicing ligase RtcB (3'-phosphate/5'-hydroxy nucleic acid ligase)